MLPLRVYVLIDTLSHHTEIPRSQKIEDLLKNKLRLETLEEESQSEHFLSRNTDIQNGRVDIVRLRL